jgi:hypothetical protein
MKNEKASTGKGRINATPAQAKECVDAIMKRIETDGVKKRLAYSEYYEPELGSGIKAANRK